jgi:hypothetical protein
MFLLDSNHYDVVILTGDLNKFNCANIAEGLELHQIINQPTRGNRILDVFYTNWPELFCTTVVRSLVHSDHLSLFINCCSYDSLEQSSFATKRKKVKCLNRDDASMQKLTDLFDNY